jgi:hydrogenase small subunit
MDDYSLNGQVKAVTHPSIADYMMNKGISRRQFLGFCGIMAAILALPASARETIAAALANTQRLPVIWLEFQGCTGDSESFLRSADQANPLDSAVREPNITDLLLDLISLDYHETLMAPSGFNAEKSRLDAIANQYGKYLLVVEGSIPLDAGGHYCVIGGKTASQILAETIAGAKATIALGTCAFDGGLAKAKPNPTGAAGVKEATNAANIIALPGCPANVVNLAATLVHLISFPGTPIELDSLGRARFAHRKKIHECYREDNGLVTQWGDTQHQNGGCLYLMGCAGTVTYSNCKSVYWNQGTCWPIQAGHGCIGCVNPGFWDVPIYSTKGSID